jgi:hypothetical protein
MILFFYCLKWWLIMKTYLEILVNSEGGSPSVIQDQLLNLGFKATRGNYDFVFEWEKDADEIDELVWFADKVHRMLKGHSVCFKIGTI